ncbi:MAG: C1 family peptidase [Crocinitomicaceae bacterium]|nr:C1 family peptidase [Crocinitomicaceae bacterium]
MKKTNLIVAFLLVGSSTLIAQERKMGLLFDDAAYKAVPMIEKPLGFGDNLPKSVSLIKYVPKIGDQGDMGTCVGWASTYYVASMEHAILTRKNNVNDVSAWVYDPLYTYMNIILDEGDKTCEDGTYLDDACEFIVKNDTKRKQIDEASCGNIPEWDESNALVDFSDYYRLFDLFTDRDETIESVCYALSLNHPVLFAMGVPRTFFSVGDDGVFVSENSDDLYGGHAMTVVGYDDEKLGGCFTVVNSWGESWGDDGYVYIKYDDFYRYCKYGYYFEAELKPVTFTYNGCMFGNCYSGYGVSKVKGNGTFEGYFSGGQMGKGIYMNLTKKWGKGGTRFIKKLAKNNGGTLIFDGYDYKKPIGVITSY